jgi:dolichol-phosphate mannosyltransferase
MLNNADNPVFSFVLPVYNEADSLAELARRLRAVISEIGEPCEIIMVDDGSVDASFQIMKSIRDHDERFKLVAFSRNFGHQAAITAGLDVARGEAIIVMDSDLQHPPEVVPKLISCWREGFAVVNAARVDRSGEGLFKRWSARAFYWMLCRLSHIEMSPNVGDFRLVDRGALSAFLAMRERNRYLRGMFTWIGFRQTTVPYDYHDRYAGKPKYTLRRMLAFGMDGIVSFSRVPLELALHLGFLVATLSFIAGIGNLIAKFTFADTVPGWLSIVILVSFLGGVQLSILGVIGTYMARIYDEVKRRPLYIARYTEGLSYPKVNADRVIVSAEIGDSDERPRTRPADHSSDC